MANTPKPRQRKNEPEDAFIAYVLEITAWAKQNARALIIGGTVAVIAVAVALYYVNFRNQLHAQATTRLTEIRQTAASGNEALAIRDLEGFVERFDNTPAADEARMLLARTYLEREEPEGAIPVVRPLARDLGDPLGVPAATLLAAAQEAAGDTDAAVETHLRIADRATFTFQRREALAESARLRLESGDADEAVRLYERALALIEDDAPERGIFRMRLAEARAAAETTSAGSGGG